MGGATEEVKQGDGLGQEMQEEEGSSQVFKDVLVGTELSREQPTKEPASLAEANGLWYPELLVLQEWRGLQHDWHSGRGEGDPTKGQRRSGRV